MLVRIAWRNLWRNRRRTIITLVSIAFGFLLSMTFTTLSDGSYGKLIDTAARMGAGHITIEPVGYRAKPGAEHVLTAPARLARTVKTFPGVHATTVRIIGQAMAATAADSTGAGYVAIDPHTEQGTSFILEHITAGTTLPSRAGNQALVGGLMARQLELKVGKKLVLTTTDRRGEVVSGLFKVAGIFTTGVDEVDKYLLILPLDAMRELLGYQHGEATQVTVYLSNKWDAPAVAQALRPIAAPYGGTALPWSEMMPDVDAIITMDKIGNYFFQFFIFLLVGAGILNTVLMGVMERMREFGVMLALGMPPRRLWSMIMLEVGWLAVVGLIVGAGASLPVFWYLHSHGIDFSAIYREKQVAGGVLLDMLARAELRLGHVANIFGGVFILILAAGLYPATLAARTLPVKTMQTL